MHCMIYVWELCVLLLTRRRICWNFNVCWTHSLHCLVFDNRMEYFVAMEFRSYWPAIYCVCAHMKWAAECFTSIYVRCFSCVCILYEYMRNSSKKTHTRWLHATKPTFLIFYIKMSGSKNSNDLLEFCTGACRFRTANAAISWAQHKRIYQHT